MYYQLLIYRIGRVFGELRKCLVEIIHGLFKGLPLELSYDGLYLVRGLEHGIVEFVAAVLLAEIFVEEEIPRMKDLRCIYTRTQQRLPYGLGRIRGIVQGIRLKESLPYISIGIKICQVVACDVYTILAGGKSRVSHPEASKAIARSHR